MKYDTRCAFWGAYIFFAVLFLLALYRPIAESFFDRDASWMVGYITQHTQGKGAWEIFSVLFSFKNRVMEACLANTLTFFCLSLFGPRSAYFIFTSLFFHFACSVLLLLLLRKMQVDLRTSIVCGLAYLLIFVHYGAYIWAVNLQQLLVIFFLLLVLNLYLSANRRVDCGRPYLGIYLATLFLNIVASLNRGPIILLPVLVLAHICFTARDRGERLKKFDLWLPFFATYLFYQPLRFAWGDSRLEIFNFFPGFLNSQSVPQKFLLLFVTGLLALLFLRLVFSARINFSLKRPKLNRVFIILAAAAVLVILAGSRHDIAFKFFSAPYKILLLLAGIQDTFFLPLRNWIISYIYWGYIELHICAWSVFLSALLLFIAARKAVIQGNRHLVIFVFWYLACLIYPEARPGLNYSIIPSRYFIYTTPVFCLVFSMVFIQVCDYAAAKLRLAALARDLISVLVLAVLLVPNIAGIKLAIFQNKMANNYLVFDYVRAADSIKGDIRGRNISPGPKADDIYIDGVGAAPLAQMLEVICNLDPARHDDCRQVFAQAFDDRSYFDININHPCPGQERSLCFRVEGQSILRTDGLDAVVFYRFFERARESLGLGRFDEAASFFRAASAVRPFLVNFMLDGLPLEALSRITLKEDLRGWINRIPRYLDFYRERGSPQISDPKIRYIAAMINDEISDYAAALVYLAYSSEAEGSREKGAELLRQVDLLDRDFVTSGAWKKRLTLTPDKVSEIDNFLARERTCVANAGAPSGNLSYPEFIIRILFLN